MNTRTSSRSGFIPTRTIIMLALYTLLTGIALRFDVYKGDVSKAMGGMVLCIAIYFAWQRPFTAIISVLFFYSVITGGANNVGLFRLNENGAILLMALAWYRAFRKGKLLPSPWLVYGFYILAITGSLWTTTRPHYNVDFYLVIAMSVLGLRLIRTEMEVRECVVGVWLAAFLVALSGLYYGTIVTPSTSELAARTAVGTHDQNYFSFFAGLALILSISMIITWYHRLSKWTILALLLTNGPVFLSLARQGSRGFVVASILPLLACVIAVRRNTTLFATSIVCMAALVSIFAFTSVGDTWRTRFHEESIQTGGERLEVFVTGAEVMKKTDPVPFLLGSGYGSSFELIGYGLRRGVEEFSAHNSWLAALIEGGVLGFACYAGFFYVLFKRVRKCGMVKCIISLSLLLYLAGESMSIEPHRNTVFWVVMAVVYAQTNPKLLRMKPMMRREHAQ